MQMIRVRTQIIPRAEIPGMGFESVAGLSGHWYHTGRHGKDDEHSDEEMSTGIPCVPDYGKGDNAADRDLSPRKVARP